MTSDKNWYALLTRSRFENVVTKSIQKKSIEVFLPKIKVKSKRRDRRLVIDVPLFPGYVFVNISLDPREQLHVLKTMGAVRLLGYQNGPRCHTQQPYRIFKNHHLFRNGHHHGNHLKIYKRRLGHDNPGPHGWRKGRVYPLQG